jgi:hypothetical protein
MKKLIVTALTLVMGAALTRSQGIVSLQFGVSGTVYTNTPSASGPIHGGLNAYYFEALDMTQSQWNSLTAGQQAAAANILENPSAVSLWTDTAISGANYTVANGGVTGLGGAAGTTAANWGAPTGASYATGSIDYYVIVGWSANLGSSWSTLASEIEGSGFGSISGVPFFGESAVAYNYSGGGPSALPPVSLWATSAATGLAGSGFSTSQQALTLYAMPEPTTIALAGLGGLSMLFLRRRKS